MGKHSRRRPVGALSKATAAAATLGFISAAPAVAATAITVRGTDILSPGDSPEAILPDYFAGYDVVDVDYPASAIGMGDSVQQGVDALDAEIAATPGDKTVAGFSQGSIVLTVEKQRLMALPADQRPAADELTFVQIGDPSGPGGILRYLPAAPQPVETPYDTVYVTREYDGWADFPDRPWNLISTANAVMGIYYVHGKYPEADLDLSSVPKENVTTSTNSQGATTTSYLIPTEKLPLVQPLRDVGVPEPVVAAVEKPLKQIVDAGYARNDTPSTSSSTSTTTKPKVRTSLKAVPGATATTTDSKKTAETKPDTVQSDTKTTETKTEVTKADDTKHDSDTKHSESTSDAA